MRAKFHTDNTLNAKTKLFFPTHGQQFYILLRRQTRRLFSPRGEARRDWRLWFSKEATQFDQPAITVDDSKLHHVHRVSHQLSGPLSYMKSIWSKPWGQEWELQTGWHHQKKATWRKQRIGRKQYQQYILKIIKEIKENTDSGFIISSFLFLVWFWKNVTEELEDKPD